MRKSVLLLLVIATLAILLVPSAVASDDATNDVLKVKGQISHGSQPIESPNQMYIQICHFEKDAEGKEKKEVDNTYEDYLDENGYFTIELGEYKPETTYYISIEELGYEVLTVSKCLTYDTEHKMYRMYLEPEGGECSITDKNDYIVMHNSFGTVTGRVVSSSGDNPSLNGVKLTLTSLDGNIVETTTTGGSGKFTFNNVGIGTYKLKAENKGFADLEYKDDIKLSAGQIYDVKTIKMEPNNDITSSHMMAIAGGVAAIIFLGCVIVYIARAKKY